MTRPIADLIAEVRHMQNVASGALPRRLFAELADALERLKQERDDAVSCLTVDGGPCEPWKRYEAEVERLREERDAYAKVLHGNHCMPIQKYDMMMAENAKLRHMVDVRNQDIETRQRLMADQEDRLAKLRRAMEAARTTLKVVAQCNDISAEEFERLRVQTNLVHDLDTMAVMAREALAALDGGEDA